MDRDTSARVENKRLAELVADIEFLRGKHGPGLYAIAVGSMEHFRMSVFNWGGTIGPPEAIPDIRGVPVVVDYLLPREAIELRYRL